MTRVLRHCQCGANSVETLMGEWTLEQVRGQVRVWGMDNAAAAA